MKNRHSVFDVIAASSPVNKQSALAVSGRSEHYDPVVKDGRLHWSERPKTIALARSVQKENDLTGRKVGRLTVIGYYGKGRDKAMWLVRCTCGDYEVRSAKAIKNPKNSGDLCYKCDHTVRLRVAGLHERIGQTSADKLRDSYRSCE